MIGIVNSVTAGDEDISKETIRKAVQEVEEDIESLMRRVFFSCLEFFINNLIVNSILGTIIKNLEELEKQNRFLLVFFRDLNKSKIDDCLGRLAIALERFNASTH